MNLFTPPVRAHRSSLTDQVKLVVRTTRGVGRVLFAPVVVLGTMLAATAHADETWRLADLARIGGHEAKVVGAPQVTSTEGMKTVLFDGAHDGFFVPDIPIAGAKAFTIEVLFSPAEGGPQAQRFFHLQDSSGRRALMEIRTDGKGWWLDTFLRGGGAKDKGCTLIDPTRVHPTARWYWVALRYDGTHMADFVNGAKELEGAIDYSPLVQGSISIGVRQNLIYWFKGRISEIRFHSEALPDDKLQRVK